MLVEITNINISYDEGKIGGVEVFFSAENANSTIFINGSVPLTTEEYAGNEPIDKLITLIKQHLKEEVSEDVTEEPEEESEATK